MCFDCRRCAVRASVRLRVCLCVHRRPGLLNIKVIDCLFHVGRRTQGVAVHSQCLSSVTDVLGEGVVCNTYGKVDTSVIAVIKF